MCDLPGLPKAPEPVKRAPAKEGGKEGEEPPPPPPDTRSWLQKNWIFAVPVVMIVRPALGTRRGSSLSVVVHRPPYVDACSQRDGGVALLCLSSCSRAPLLPYAGGVHVRSYHACQLVLYLPKIGCFFLFPCLPSWASPGRNQHVSNAQRNS